MKSLKLFLIASMAGISGFAAFAQMNRNMTSSNTETFKVWGNCIMCKTRIEKAVKKEGVTSADWDHKTKLLTVVFNHSKTSTDALEQKLAIKVHDTEKYKAEDKAYKKLPACCKYVRSVNY